MREQNNLRKYTFSLYMRKIITLLVFITSYTLLNAQFRSKDVMDRYDDIDHQQFSWGYYLGINYFSFKLHPEAEGLNSRGKFLVNVDSKAGFTVGLIGKMRINEYLDLRVEPAMHFVQRDLIFRNIQNIINQEVEEGKEPTYTDLDAIRNVKSTYIDIPVFINFHGNKWNNTRPYVQAGLSYLMNLQGSEKKEQDNLEQVFRMKDNNFSYQLEAGIEIYLKRFKLTPSVRGIFFINDELVKDNPGTPLVWAGAIKSMSTRAIVFSLKFE